MICYGRALSVFSILLLLLRGSANFKIGIMHAASALAVPNLREGRILNYEKVGFPEASTGIVVLNGLLHPLDRHAWLPQLP